MTTRQMLRSVFGAAFLALTVASGWAAAQASPSPSTTLVVAGDVATALSLTSADLKTLPRVRVEAKSEDGTAHVYEGVLVAELLKRAGAPVGAELRGNAFTTYVLASGSDGYQAVFSLAELDPAFTSNDIIVADAVDGKPLSNAQGAFRIVAPKDVRGSRSVRMLQRLDVVRLRK